jgi:hypothetical protein
MMMGRQNVALKDLPEGIEMLRRGEALKVVVYPSK